MRLSRVTITGADDTTDIYEMKELSAQYPFLEWGILVSARHEGTTRFPSRKWIDGLSAVAVGAMSTHICGRWTREILRGEIDWAQLPSCLEVGLRLQINTHAQEFVSKAAMIGSLMHHCAAGRQIIFQWDGVNDHLAAGAVGMCAHLNVAALFDKSGGAGIEPQSWPVPPPNMFHFGYAGGIGPDNVVRIVAQIAQHESKGHPFWIDMERRVRTEDDSALGMAKVRSVLSQCADVIAIVDGGTT